jgi:WD40 repeat protein
LLHSSSGEELRTLRDSPGPAACFAVSPDGSTLATAGKDRIVRLWSLESGRVQTTLKGHTDIVWALAFAPDGKSLASIAWDGTCRVWDLARQQPWQLLRKAQCYTASFSPDSQTLACGGRGVQFWNVATASLASEVPLPSENDISVAFTAGGLVAAAGTRGRVYLIGPPYDRVLHEWQGHAGKIWGLAAAPDGKLLATGGEDGLTKLWELNTQTLKQSLVAQGTTVTALAFTPDGLQLISGTWWDLQSWDVATGKLLATIEEQSPRVCVSPDGHWLAAANTARLSLRELPSLKLSNAVHGHSDHVYQVAFSSDSRTVATASWDGTAVLWHRASGQPLLTVPASAGVAWCAAFALDGSAMAVGSGSAERGEISLLYAPRSADLTDPSPVGSPVTPSEEFPVSRAVLKPTIARRDPSTPANLVDLTPFYNGSPTSGWIPSSASGSSEDRNLGELPMGVHPFGDVSFDVRGVVQLAGRTLNGFLGASYPRQVSGIPIGLKCRRLHVLHGTGWMAPGGLEIGRFVLHHGDGRVSILPIRYGEDVRDWWGGTNETSHATVAWTGYNAATRKLGFSFRLYRRTWDNPYPDVVLDRVDYESTFTRSSPFLIALTVE